MPNYRVYIETNKVYTTEELAEIEEKFSDALWGDGTDMKVGDHLRVSIDYD